jgi:uncharacterized membrane protein
MIQVTLYTRTNCLLCEEVLNDLNELESEFPHEVKVVNIDHDLGLVKKYGDQIPVVLIDQLTLKAPISEFELRYALQTAFERRGFESRGIKKITVGEKIQHELEESGKDRENLSKPDRFSCFLSKHYLAIINILVILFLGLPVLAPVLMKIGWTTPAVYIYRFYSVTCHQLAFRSFFLFGSQYFYPREVAEIPGVKPYHEVTQLGEGNSPEEILIARNFIGDEIIGYKIALCQRDLAIYTGILAFNLVFALSRRKIKPLNWVIWILIGLVPVGIDGLSQLISQPPLSILPFRESTPFFRVLTGFLFGFTTAWFGIPHIHATMIDSLEQLEYKRSHK